ncbi:hypothetical protein F0U60_21940 [Archangium minus]|uniref:Uncharacterized protein n=1 Tax=Archangium minus TaxID=83450 RepID=A0ABY9WRX4_9BACT|nr:hypothetical protein F0U60_21940 [Archangium minus]
MYCRIQPSFDCKAHERVRGHLVRRFVLESIKRFSLIAILLSCGTVAAQGYLAGAWYVGNASQIDRLEAQGFNLLLLDRGDFSQPTPPAGGWARDRNAHIDDMLAALDTGSMAVLPLDIYPFYTQNWFSPEGMCQFVKKYGSHPKVYGFMLRDDVNIKDNVGGCASAQDGDVTCPRISLWVVRWLNQMIRGTAGQANDCNGGASANDLAPGKKVMVTFLFDPSQNTNGHKYRWFDPKNVPPNFFTPGDTWDIILPYWYSHRYGVGPQQELNEMNTLYKDMASVLNTRYTIPILQAVDEPYNATQDVLNLLAPATPMNSQYCRFRTHGVVNPSGTRAIIFFTANGGLNNLLHRDGVEDISPSNYYYWEAGKTIQLHKNNMESGATCLY